MGGVKREGQEKLKNTEDKRIDGGGRWRKERNRGRGKGPTLEKIGAHVARYNITLLAHLSLHSRPSFICKTIVAALLWRIVGSRASGPVYHTSFISRHLLPALSPFFVFFLILLPPSSLHPYLISPIGLLNRWCSLLHHPYHPSSPSPLPPLLFPRLLFSVASHGSFLFNGMQING